MKRAIMLAMAVAGAEAFASPVVSDVTLTQADDRTVTVAYTLADGPAIVTVDFLTNGVSVGGSHIRTLAGDVNGEVANGAHVLTWRPDATVWKGVSAEVTAAVSAWPLSEPPPYAVVSLATNAIRRVRYYPSVDQLPGGLLDCDEYRTRSLVLRKVPAKGVSWKMGEKETVKSAWTANYYLGVFEVTQAQWAMVMQDGASGSTYRVGGGLRPMESMLYAEWATGDDSYLARLNEQVGMAFRLPTEAEWEYACRSGYANGYFNEGSVKNADNAKKVARHYANSGGSVKDAKAPLNKATAVVGSYAPSAWGFYDMLGNVWEYTSTIYSGTTHVRKGGSHDQGASKLDLYYRYNDTADRSSFTGVRLCLSIANGQ